MLWNIQIWSQQTVGIKFCPNKTPLLGKQPLSVLMGVLLYLTQALRWFPCSMWWISRYSTTRLQFGFPTCPVQVAIQWWLGEDSKSFHFSTCYKPCSPTYLSRHASECKIGNHALQLTSLDKLWVHLPPPPSSQWTPRRSRSMFAPHCGKVGQLSLQSQLLMEKLQTKS